MNKLLKRFIPLLVIFFSITSNIFAQDAVTRALDLINKNLILGDYERSYNYAKFVANYYENEEIPADVLSTIKDAVAQRADNLVATGQYDTVLEMEEELKDYPASIQKAISPALTKTKAHFKNIEEEKQRKAEAEKKALEEQQKLAAEAQAKAEKEAETQRLKEYYEEQRKIELEKAELERKQQAEQAEKDKIAQQAREDQLRKEAQELEAKLRAEEAAQKQKERAEDYALQQKQRQEDLDMQIALYEQQRVADEQRLELERQRQQADEEYRQQMSQMLSSMNENSNTTMLKLSKNNRSMILFIFVIVVIFVVIIVFVVFISLRQLRNHQEQMKDTIMIMQAQSLKSTNSLNETLPLLLQMQTLSLAANNLSLPQQRSNLALEDNSTGPKDDQSEITELITNCKKFGKQIDEASGRKNVSMRVADLVLKISQQLGHAEYDCILYYAAALVYDIGFLNIDSSILKSGTLTEAQFKVVQTHPSLGEKMLFFVEEKYRPLFVDAVSKHHENLDGTGYPSGLKEEEIPYIARVLRVAESYIALISNRTYKEIRDGDSAIAELRNLPSHYDQTIVDALDAIL